MNYQTLNEKLTGRNRDSRKLGNNTYAERRGESAIAIKLHATDVVTFYADGRVSANSGGWRTHTTKDRINEYFPLRLWQKRGEWHVSNNGESVLFADGITVDAAGKITGAGLPSAESANKALRKRIAAYCKGLAAALPLPMPSAGDCWHCGMREEKTGLPLGEVSKDRSHLESHLSEKYYVPSLVWRALEFGGCNPKGCGCAWFEVAFGTSKIGSPDTVVRMVRRYLLRQFGLA